MQLNIRKYKDNDLQGVLSCWENASRLAHTFVSEAFMNEERYNIPNVYLPNADTWVVEIKNQTVGFIALLGYEVGAIFVEPEFHGAGVGRALMDKARELHGDLEVKVFKANHIGRRFYSNYEFELLSESIDERTGHELLKLKFTEKTPTNKKLYFEKA